MNMMSAADRSWAAQQMFKLLSAILLHEEVAVSDQIVDYKGYQIVPQPTCDFDGLWFSGYEILKNGMTIRQRMNIYPTTFYFQAACAESIGHAKIEIENLVAAASG
jgi:hypothetical protein